MAHDGDVKEPLTLGGGRKFTAEYGGFEDPVTGSRR
jgi:predicted PhzF superfamily epimerase YddE/YHI9